MAKYTITLGSHSSPFFSYSGATFTFGSDDDWSWPTEPPPAGVREPRRPAPAAPSGHAGAEC